MPPVVMIGDWVLVRSDLEIGMCCLAVTYTGVGDVKIKMEEQWMIN